MPGSAEYFGTRGLVKVQRHRRRPTVPELVHGARRRSHKLPIKADVAQAIAQDAGDTVTVQLKRRLDD